MYLQIPGAAPFTHYCHVTKRKVSFPDPERAHACKPVRRAPTWLTTALMKWNALHTIPAPGGDFCHNTPVEYKRHLAVATFHQSGACWWWPTAIQIRFPNSLTTPTSSSKFRIGLGRLNGVKWYQVCLVWCYCFQKANVVHTSCTATYVYVGFSIPFQSKLHRTHNLISDYEYTGWM